MTVTYPSRTARLCADIVSELNRFSTYSMSGKSTSPRYSPAPANYLNPDQYDDRDPKNMDYIHALTATKKAYDTNAGVLTKAMAFVSLESCLLERRQSTYAKSVLPATPATINAEALLVSMGSPYALAPSTTPAPAAGMTAGSALSPKPGIVASMLPATTTAAPHSAGISPTALHDIRKITDEAKVELPKPKVR